MSKGTLYLLPVPLSDQAASASYTTYFSEVVNAIDEYIVENEKTARKFLKQAGLKMPQQQLVLHDYGKHARDEYDKDRFFKALLEGKDVGLMSEAGCPGIADPGADIVARAHQLGIKVRPLVGPNSMILALMASGFNGQTFAFHGYLPIDKAARAKKIKELEQVAQKAKQTQLFMETPFRNNQLLEEVLKVCSPKTRLCIACNITDPDEWISSDSIENWKKKKVDLHKKPAIFLLL
ncbi:MULTISPECIES: SAM-dependent methyltransferase [Olivibacter]|jgi:16S rRNA (cytidine1402-2'-O)-methyltransferase|uniref:SAM-dependent methyltransferase n=2 Tax=Olivibacter TaxID=376469 RepID=A0ABV6HFE5_9SPHI|nr:MULTISPECIES: SAM-dependent methyltransferase [Olivibacter]MCL4638801.1 SAM-dependent methyltransferase [Olivibacter sp. UJ_SKK_5.1]MDX3912353.1 SAM-dependent methyltransferase [Pseudosphingobacterium sp.]QEL00076.1 SAM-dependent methyltransferase [Olivibacter sp. LS-1]